MSLCKELGLTLKEGYEKLSSFEMKLWAAYFKIENERTKEYMNKQSQRR